MASDDRRRQVATTRERHGQDHYKKIGSKGGKLSTTKFTSEAGSKASKIRWAKEKERRNNEQTKEQ